MCTTAPAGTELQGTQPSYYLTEAGEKSLAGFQERALARFSWAGTKRAMGQVT